MTSNYWRQRAARETYERLKPVEERGAHITKMYTLASSRIETDVKKLIRRFMLQYELTEKEARALLRKVRTPGEIEALIAALEKNPKSKDLAAELASQAYAARLGRLAAVQRNVKEVIEAVAEETESIMAGTLKDVAEDAYYREIFGLQQRADAVFAVTPVSDETLTDTIDTPWSGRNYSERLWGNTDALARRVQEEIEVSVLTGKPASKAAQAIADEFHKGANDARRLLRTEANYVNNQMKLKSFKELGVENYIYCAVLDLKTSQICREHDKNRYPVDEAEVGENFPPLHPWCRSTVLADMPEELMERMTQSAFDPETGTKIKVPMNMRYEEWYDKYVKPMKEKQEVKT